MRFLLLILALHFSVAPIFADEARSIRQQLDREVKASQKRYGVNSTALPNLNSQDWKVHLIAEEEAFSEVIEVQGNSIVHVGKTLVADRIIIHGDGVVWVSGIIQCQTIDIRGKGLVMFDTNSVHYNRGWIKIDQGTVLSKGINQMNVHLRKGGFLRSGGDNLGEVLVSSGDLKIDVHGNQKGDINFGSSRGKVDVKILGDLEGKFSSKGAISLQVGGDLKQSLIGDSSIKIKAGKVLGDQLSAGGHLEADLHQLGERLNPTSVSAKSALIRTAKGRFGDVSLVENGEFMIGGASEGAFTSLQGSIKARIAGYHEGKISAGGAIDLDARDSKGDLVAARNLKANVKETLISHRLASGGEANVSCSIFEGNMNIKGRAMVSAMETRRGPFATLISMGSGKISVKGAHKLDTISKGNLELLANRGSGYIKSNGPAKVSFSGDHLGKIVVKGPLDLAISGRQDGSIYAGSQAKVKISTLSSALSVMGVGNVELTKLVHAPYEDSTIQIGSGTLKVQSDCTFDIEGLSAGQWLKVSVQGKRASNATSKGHLELTSTGSSLGQIEAGGQLTLRALSHEGKVQVGETCDITIVKDWFGDIHSSEKTGTSKFTAATIRDSNLLFQGALDLKPEKLSISYLAKNSSEWLPARSSSIIR